MCIKQNKLVYRFKKDRKEKNNGNIKKYILQMLRKN